MSTRFQTSNQPKHFMLEVAKGNVPGHTGVDVAGTSSNVDSGVLTDIWDRANATDDQDIWIAPTAARVHQIVSSSASDDGSPGGVGARTISVRGLTGWATKEVSETITMNGTTNVATSNSYVIIHFMEVLTKGATDVNVGVIKATADTDSTVTAQINAGAGRTQMTILGVPSVQTIYIMDFSASLGASGAAKEVEIDLLINPEPDVELLNFILDFHAAIAGAGTSAFTHPFVIPEKHAGPLIIKAMATGDAVNLEVDAEFELILVDN